MNTLLQSCKQYGTKSYRRVLFLYLLIFFQLFSCNVSLDITDDNSLKIVYSFEQYTCESYLAWKDGLASQGCAIYDGYLYQFRHSGMVDCYELKDDSLVFINKIALNSLGSNNHCNSVQFDRNKSNSNYGIIYVSASVINNRACYVERICTTHSELIQTIKIGTSTIIPSTMGFNFQVGDDGYLWLVGYFDSTLRFVKIRKPDISIPNVTLSDEDIIDYWERKDYNYENEALQGMKIYEGHLYLVYGGSYNRRGIWVYNTETHHLERNIDMTGSLFEEFEDIEFYNNYGYLFVLSNYIYRFCCPSKDVNSMI